MLICCKEIVCLSVHIYTNWSHAWFYDPCLQKKISFNTLYYSYIFIMTWNQFGQFILNGKNDWKRKEKHDWLISICIFLHRCPVFSFCLNLKQFPKSKRRTRLYYINCTYIHLRKKFLKFTAIMNLIRDAICFYTTFFSNWRILRRRAMFLSSNAAFLSFSSLTWNYNIKLCFC